ncbi:MAG TPA: GGDEF domain-containing protein, partial [Candidatus Acidoferrum sp.]|nr:GGDEF domain-containing protein [Candidatus Acidoferrum sp.]
LARADATYDGLTGLLTPRAFRTRLRDEIASARFGAHKVLTLWFVDTDRFKAVNDTHGHAAGDAVLQAMAELLRAQGVPEVDVAGRNGGDEFCALIHDAQKTVAIERAQSFCEAVRRHEFGVPLRITASVGVASFPHDARDANELLEVADAAMYHSKRTGRDRVSFAVNGTTFAVFREGRVGSDSAV